MKIYRGTIEMKNWNIIPLLLAVSKSNINGDANVYTIHITPLFAFGITWRTKSPKPDDPSLVSKKAVTELRNELYDSLPTGEISAWDLTSVISAHIKKLDELTK